MARKRPTLRMGVYTAILLLLLVFFAGGATAQVAPAPAPSAPVPTAPASVAELSAKKTDVEIGESIAVSVRIPLGGEFEDAELKLPEDQQIQFFVSPTKKVAGPAEFIFDVAALHEGDLTFGPATVTVRAKGAKETTEMTSNALTFKVAAPTEKAAPGEIKGYTQPMELPFNYLYRNLILAAAGLIVLLVATALFIYFRKRMQKRVVIAAPTRTLPPVEEALLQVRDLKKLETFTAMGAEKHYTQLSMTLRRYLEQCYRVNATERTEDEIVDLLRTKLQTTPLANTLIAIMQRMSLAKFAKQEPTGQIAYDDCVTAENFLVSERDRRGSAPGGTATQEGQAA
ncbi:hypothetical protein IT571_10760 [Candidatus Sumerlaeota bacterium]|nr:hypothetical protein [Candidatus Sumerlaeota bacterium]